MAQHLTIPLVPSAALVCAARRQGRSEYRIGDCLSHLQTVVKARTCPCRLRPRRQDL